MSSVALIHLGQLRKNKYGQFYCIRFSIYASCNSGCVLIHKKEKNQFKKARFNVPLSHQIWIACNKLDLEKIRTYLKTLGICFNLIRLHFNDFYFMANRHNPLYLFKIPYYEYYQGTASFSSCALFSNNI